MNKIIWNKNSNSGINQIDKQHKFLVDRMNELVELNNQNEDSFNLYPIILLLISYTQFHFEYEENYLIKCNYYGLEKYSLQRQNLLKEIDDFNENYINGSIDIDEKLIIRFKNFLETHISGDYFLFLKEFVQKGEKDGD